MLSNLILYEIIETLLERFFRRVQKNCRLRISTLADGSFDTRTPMHGQVRGDLENPPAFILGFSANRRLDIRGKVGKLHQQTFEEKTFYTSLVPLEYGGKTKSSDSL